MSDQPLPKFRRPRPSPLRIVVGVVALTPAFGMLGLGLYLLGVFLTRSNVDVSTRLAFVMSCLAWAAGFAGFASTLGAIPHPESCLGRLVLSAVSLLACAVGFVCWAYTVGAAGYN